LCDSEALLQAVRFFDLSSNPYHISFLVSD